jgi:orotidine-5'-phosphate decarboxylase
MLFLQHGKRILEYLSKKNKRIFLDLKIHDTPRVVSDTVSQFVEMGVDVASIHCLGGKEMLEEASRQCRNTQLKLIGMTVLTSHPFYEKSSFGFEESSLDLFMNLVKIALECRLNGVLCSPHEINLVKQSSPKNFDTFCAGIRINNEPVFEEDQKRIATAKLAFDTGADYIIVGRPITQSREPLKSLKELFL